MTALTKDRATPNRSGEHVSHPMLANAKIFAGALVVVDANGWAKPAATATGLKAVGRAERFADNTGGANGAASVLVRRLQVFLFENKSDDLVDRGDIGADCWIVDDQTVAGTSGGDTRSVAGKVVDVDADGVWVEIR